MPKNVSVIILTLNEEKNLPHALASVVGWANEVIVVDSLSSDRTSEIAVELGARVFERKFIDYASQRNFALNETGIASEWVFFLDADEWLPQELRDEIDAVLATDPVENGFWIKRRLHWMGKWIKHGYYPTWLLRLGRKEKLKCEPRIVNEHLVVEGATGKLKSDFIDENRNGIHRWHEKHLRYAEAEASLALKTIIPSGNFFGNQMERKRWLYSRVWNRLPLFLRPQFYFVFRYFIRGGFLGGRSAFLFHFYQALWYPMLIDTHIYLQKRDNAK